ncbi:MAG: hypothetical protein E6767_09985 [Dysgonomonas sp.]|nr:hypothetical protein [Dysgonomonas sp.]
MKKLLLILCCIFFSKTIFAQDIFVDKTTNQKCLFLGSLSLDRKKVKALENGQILWKDFESAERTEILSTQEFLDTIFSYNLQFELSGYEPFWRATLTSDGISYTDYETNKTITYPIKISIGHSLDSELFFMFSSPSENVSGLIYFNSLATPDTQRYCEFDIPEEENQLYCSFLSIGDRSYKGCAIITLR